MKRILLASLLALAASPVAADEAFGSWTFKVITDPMSDATRGIAHTSMDNDLTIVLKCDSNGPGSIYMSVLSERYLGSGRYKNRDIRYRFDGGEPETIRANYDGRSASIFDLTPSKAGGSFISQLAEAEETVIQVTSYDFDSYTSVIDTRGAREAISRVATTCRDTEWTS